ncbi:MULTISPECIES: type I DNA topoisomerase [unclassified Leptolyngbya]|uniref:type I DNA topoisomerase n=1 Tax=unclassified Leptolyngbya TaxID=2650499 RepID=UPI001685FC05|nr:MULTISPECIES: type I DNA topoisomerase [unclassified Leptolyngbya]MBD1913960.1 type I DNA topoisomerase [Leptolyngbya sp. FACHB-8]MBD2155927.1 type I DNA topoisomerase [Leptolyngbya sp. FACHB-16]
MANLLLIESPGKSKKLSQILGPGWIVKASMGHIRELANDGEDALGFDLGNTIDCRYIPRGDRGKKVIADLRQAVKQAEAVYIATDPDREGETIGWHLQQELRIKNPRRVVYSEITPQAVRAAIAHPRSLDQSLIAAGRARDCLDKLVGYKGSKHVVWKLNIGAKSMGRVQSATLHLLCLREKEIQAFQPQDYWSVWVEYAEGFKAFYRANLKALKPASEEELDDAAAEKKGPESDRVTSQEEADRLVAIARNHPHQVVKVDGKVTTQSPPPPFITSSLQQAAGAKLKFSPDKTMKVAQSLYEAGFITYMRTDSVMLAAPFCDAVREYLERNDPDNVPSTTTRHRAVKGAQEAHEAIRPTDVNRLPAQLSGDDGRLYELIWNRAIASQCCPARLRKSRILSRSENAHWEARGQIVEFAGYTRYWNNLSADTQLPTVQQGQPLTLKQAGSEKKQTQPPPRYTEPKLVQLMERKGIGRPSTYAPTIKTLKERDYVQVNKGKLHPTALGLSLDGALEELLPDLLQPEFTAQMESALDTIAQGQQDWQAYLTTWHQTYFAPALEKARQILGSSASPGLRTENFSASKAKPASTKTKKRSSKTASPPEMASAKAGGAIEEISEGQHRSHGIPTQTPCPKCQNPMHKISSHSKKMKADHFLKCITPACGTVMFWNPKNKRYELPYAERSLSPDRFVDHPCPVCGALLERYVYTKEGKEKAMLRCSLPDHRRDKCKEVAFFEGRDGFWSPKFGTLKLETLHR